MNTAKLLYRQGKREADYRSAVSRAYYACFLHAREVVFRAADRVDWQKLGETSNISHSNLPKYLKLGGKACKTLGESLAEWRERRFDADYDLQVEKQWELEAKQVIDESKELLEKIDSISRTEIRNAVSAYAARISGRSKGRQAR